MNALFLLYFRHSHINAQIGRGFELMVLYYKIPT
jgi:hypothetical protein